MIDRRPVDSLQEGLDALGAGDTVPVVAVTGPVPDWLPSLVAAAVEGSAQLIVELQAVPEGAVADEGCAGHEIGLLCALLPLPGVTVEGVDERRVQRVAEVLRHLAGPPEARA